METIWTVKEAVRGQGATTTKLVVGIVSILMEVFLPRATLCLLLATRVCVLASVRQLDFRVKRRRITRKVKKEQ